MTLGQILGHVAQLVTSQIADLGARSQTFLEIDHELFSTFILLLSLIQEGLVSVTSESMYTKHWQTCPGKRVVRLTDLLDVTIAVDWDVKSQAKQNNAKLPYTVS